jgi:hypothetical protein
VAQDPALAEAVADAVLAHPAVVRLSGGAFGTVASYLPGRRVVGVRLPLADSEPVEIAVVARMGAVLPLLAAELGAAVAAVTGPGTVDVTVTDVEAGPAATPVDAAAAPVPPGRPQTGGLA